MESRSFTYSRAQRYGSNARMFERAHFCKLNAEFFDAIVVLWRGGKEIATFLDSSWCWRGTFWLAGKSCGDVASHHQLDSLTEGCNSISRHEDLLPVGEVQVFASQRLQLFRRERGTYRRSSHTTNSLKDRTDIEVLQAYLSGVSLDFRRH
jgi:hypothetical protein